MSKASAERARKIEANQRRREQGSKMEKMTVQGALDFLNKLNRPIESMVSFLEAGNHLNEEQIKMAANHIRIIQEYISDQKNVLARNRKRMLKYKGSEDEAKVLAKIAKYRVWIKLLKDEIVRSSSLLNN